MEAQRSVSSTQPPRQRTPRRLRRWVPSLLVLGGLLLPSCSTTIDNRDPVGERLPTLMGSSLEDESVTLPLDTPSVLLVGYVQKAQFDADRWLIGLLQATPPVTILEVPAVAGLFPRMLADTIDSGMRSGIPSEDWQSVVTLYGSDADDLRSFTGNERARNIRVLLVDAEGRVRWFHDRGFSAGKLLELVAAAEALVEPVD